MRPGRGGDADVPQSPKRPRRDVRSVVWTSGVQPVTLAACGTGEHAIKGEECVSDPNAGSTAGGESPSPHLEGAEQVRLGERSYPIVIEPGCLADLHGCVGPGEASFVRTGHVIIVTDHHVAPHWGPELADPLESCCRVTRITVPAGERSKSVEQAEHVWQELARAQADRSSVLIALGGGVVGDLAGFAAATYMRGIRFIQVPTSLLAQVDSSVGGKTGINLPRHKNIVGAFWQPQLVWVDPATLATLPEREYRSGLAEVVKYGVILDADFFHHLETAVGALKDRDPASLTSVIRRCCQLKAAVVAEDERETTGRRAILNYGHTFGHAFESVLDYGRILHGEAVAVGMMCAADLAVRLSLVNRAFVDRLGHLLSALELPLRLAHPAPTDRILAAMRGDKKQREGELRFVLPRRMGEVEVVGGVPEPLLREVLEARASS